MSGLRLEVEFTAEQTRRVAVLARLDGLTVDEWLKREAVNAARLLCRESDKMKPKDVARELGVSYDTVRRYIHNGAFPNVVFVNEKNIKIPRSDYENFLLTRRATA